MQKNDFINWISSYPGISHMVREAEFPEVEEQVAQLFSVTIEELEQVLREGAYEGKVSYRKILWMLFQNITHYDRAYEALEDDCSRIVFTSLVQYQIIPDQSFFDRIAVSHDIHESDQESASPLWESVQEGCGVKAVMEAESRIRKAEISLEVCCRDIFREIWEIPELIRHWNKDYRFYLRCKERNGQRKIMLYAILRGMAKETRQEKKRGPGVEKKQKRIVALAPYERGWSNVELIKDCGLIPYLLYRNHGCDVTMTGAKGEESYPYLDAYVKGIKMEFLADGKEETKLNYIREQAARIDGLILRGFYATNFNAARLYKQLNPHGRIYVGLDANSHWTDRVQAGQEDFADFMEFMDCCDVIATSCRVMQKHLNVKWPWWKIEYIPNGFYPFGRDFGAVWNFDRKEDVILTVGRLGTKQKAVDILLEAFAKLGPEYGQWKLKLVGSMTEEFEAYMDEYYNRFPELKNRVQMTGTIQDREALFGEYEKAKIFALSSIYEGGTPNVVAEALYAGCVMAVSKFDAYEEAIDCGNCGMAAEIGDIEGYASILRNLCKNSRLREMSRHAYEYGHRNFDMEKITARLYEMMFGSERIQKRSGEAEHG